jgi:DHA1 family tetracycline resistance protein-like MFS transporter
MSLYAFLRLGLAERAIGFILSGMGVFQVLFRVLAFNRIRDRLGDVRTSLVGYCTFIVSFSLLALVVTTPQFVAVFMVISFSIALTKGILIGLTSRVSTPRQQGKVMGLTSSLDSVSQMVGPLIGSYMLSVALPWAYAVTLLVLILVPFVMQFRVIGFRIEGQAPSPPVVEELM